MPNVESKETKASQVQYFFPFLRKECKNYFLRK